MTKTDFQIDNHTMISLALVFALILATWAFFDLIDGLEDSIQILQQRIELLEKEHYWEGNKTHDVPY